MIEFIKIIGGLAGLIALIWKLIELRKKYLILKLEVSQDNEAITAFTTIENKDIFKKQIDNALLIISPEKDTIENILERIKDRQGFESINKDSVTDFFSFKPSEAIYFDNNYAFIPLPYYYDGSENLHVADETITFRCSIDKTKFENGIYSVRFYLFCQSRYPRSTHDLMIIK